MWWVCSGWAGTRPPRPSQSSRRLWSRSAQTPVQLQHIKDKEFRTVQNEKKKQRSCLKSRNLKKKNVNLILTKRWQQSNQHLLWLQIPKLVISSGKKRWAILVWHGQQKENSWLKQDCTDLQWDQVYQLQKLDKRLFSIFNCTLQIIKNKINCFC